MQNETTPAVAETTPQVAPEASVSEPIIAPVTKPETTQNTEQPAHAPEILTGQIVGIDPLNNPAPVEPASAPQPVEASPPQIQPSKPPIKSLRDFLVRGIEAIRGRRQKKLDRIIALLNKSDSITNDDVEKLLNVSDSTATRYLLQLTSEGKIKQSTKTGRWVVYTKV